jgi:hypothetical protein
MANMRNVQQLKKSFPRYGPACQLARKFLLQSM